MTRIKNDIHAAQKESLIKHVYLKFGKKITYSFECETLSAEIQASTEYKIGSNTLRRFFGFLESNFSASSNTLNGLAAYAGFIDWNTFTLHEAEGTYEPLTLDQEAKLYLNFYSIEAKEEGDMNYHNACRNIALRTLNNKGLLNQLSPLLAKIPTAQIYFFERFPYIDGLCDKSYKKSIELYLQKNSDEAKIFGYCLLFLSAFLSKNFKSLNILRERINKLKVNAEMHPFLVARFIGSNLLFAEIKGEDLTPHFIEIDRWNKYFLNKKRSNFWHYPYFQHMICDYLNLAKQFDFSKSILRITTLSQDKFEVEQGYKEALDIIRHIPKHLTDVTLFKRWRNNPKFLTNIHPLFKKYFELQILCVDRLLVQNKNKWQKTKKSEKIENRISTLINETGFIYFEDFLINDPHE